MLDDQSPKWWYEEAGQQAGPVTEATLQRMIAEGRLSPAHRVWRDGMAGWVPLAQVAELAPATQTWAPRPPPLETGPAPALSRPPLATTAVPSLEEIPVGTTIVLAVVTFGVYGLVKFHQSARGYERLAGRESRFGLYFWLFIGLGLGGIVMNATSGVLGLPLGIASAVFQVLTLNEALAVRAEGMRRVGVDAPVTSASTHRTLLILAIVLSFVLVGLVLAAVQAAKWFADWNRIVAAVRGRPA